MVARYLKLILAVLIVGILAAYILLVIIPEKSYELARSIGNDFNEAFHFTPEVTVRNTIVLHQQTTVLELATLSQNFQHQYSWTNTWMGSTKQIFITGSFEAKCGFDLQKKFSIQLDGTTATVYLPEPKILSIEPQGDISFRDESGIWNWVSDEDRARATNAFIIDARAYAEHADFVHDGKEKAEEKIRALLKLYADSVIFVYQDTPKLKQGM